MALYNLRSADGDWRITKFDNDLNPLQSYLVSIEACECPAGVRPTCRHRQMLPKMLAVQAEDSGMFYDFEADQFLATEVSEPELPSTNAGDIEPQLSGLQEEQILMGFHNEVEPQRGLPALATEPLAVATYIELPATADVAEEFAKLRNHPTGITIKRRF